MLKKLLSFILYFFVSLFVGNVFVTIFGYFNIFNNNTINIVSFIYPLLLVVFFSFLLGRSSIKKGFIEGFKFGGIISITFLIIILFFNCFDIKVFIYYTIIVLSSILSSTVGINTKKNA